jgi:hypothetical protein
MNSRRRIGHPSNRFSGSLSRRRMQGNGYIEACRWFDDRTKGPFAAAPKVAAIALANKMARVLELENHIRQQ